MYAVNLERVKNVTVTQTKNEVWKDHKADKIVYAHSCSLSGETLKAIRFLPPIYLTSRFVRFIVRVQSTYVCISMKALLFCVVLHILQVGILAFSHRIQTPSGCFGTTVAAGIPANLAKLKKWVRELRALGK